MAGPQAAVQGVTGAGGRGTVLDHVRAAFPEPGLGCTQQLQDGQALAGGRCQIQAIQSGQTFSRTVRAIRQGEGGVALQAAGAVPGRHHMQHAQPLPAGIAFRVQGVDLRAEQGGLALVPVGLQQGRQLRQQAFERFTVTMDHALSLVHISANSTSRLRASRWKGRGRSCTSQMVAEGPCPPAGKKSTSPLKGWQASSQRRGRKGMS